MKYCIDIINQFTKKGSPIFIEIFYVNKKGNGQSSDTISFILAKVVGVASALGNSVSMKWLEIPFNNNFERVSLSTTVVQAVAKVAEQIRKYGTDNFIISTYFGIQTLPTPVEGFREFLACFLDMGLSNDEVHIVSSINPGKILQLTD